MSDRGSPGDGSLSRASLGFASRSSRRLQLYLKQLPLQLVEVMGKRNPVVKSKLAGRLVVELKDPLSKLIPERKALRREPDDAGALVFFVGDALDESITF